MRTLRLIAIGIVVVAPLRWLAIRWNEGQADSILRKMAAQGGEFDPGPLNLLGAEGLSAVLDRLLERTSKQVGTHGFFMYGSDYADGFTAFSSQVTDAERLTVIAESVVEGCAAGNPYGDRRKVIRAAIQAVLQSNNDQVISRLAPLVKYADDDIPRLLVDELTSRRMEDFAFMPDLYFEALTCRHHKVVDEALSWATENHNAAKAPGLRAALRQVFMGTDKELKFQACFPLMYEFHDREAIAYLVEQARNPDPDRARCAVVWLGDVCNNRWPPEPGVVEAIKGHVDAADPVMQGAAIRSMGTYPGHDTVDVLVNVVLGADPAKIEQVHFDLRHRMLPGHPDFEMLQRRLTEVRDTANDADVKQRCQALLDEMDANVQGLKR
jgi:hypothetical protein